MKLVATSLCFALGLVACVTTDSSPTEITDLEVSGTATAGEVTARFGTLDIRGTQRSDSFEWSCTTATGEPGDFETCATAFAQTSRAAEDAFGEAPTSSLAACWVKLDHCVTGGAYCTARGCTFDQSGDACTDLYYSYCRPWGY